VVGHGADATGDGVARLPVGGEVGARAVVDAGGLGVLGEAGLLVDADGAALLALVVLLLEVLGVGRAPDAGVVLASRFKTLEGV
jgi:hypothetical protein